jgi:lysophospholipase
MTAASVIFDRRSIPDNAVETMWSAADGWQIRRIDWHREKTPSGKARGSILFLPGRGDHYEKYLETLEYYAQAGWAVTSIDWRGQGMSGRFLDDPGVGHIEDFAIWVADLKYFYTKWQAETPGPHVVIAHSMGGHLAMRALAEKAINPVAVVMSAPMLGIQSGGLPISLNHAFARLMEHLGRGEKAAWKVSEKPMSTMQLRAKILTHDKERYEDELAWWKIRPSVKLGPPSWHWIERAMASTRMLDENDVMEAVQTPILLIATTADQLVSTDRIIKDSKRLPHAQLLLFGKEAAHELLREADGVRDKCIAAMDEFLDKYAPV